MSLEVQKNQFVAELPLSISKHRDSQKQLAPQAVEQLSQTAEKTPVPEDMVVETDQVEQRLQQQVDKINQRIQNSALKFEVIGELGATVVKVVDTQTNKVIRQIPSEEAIAQLRDIQAYLEQNVYSQSSSGSKIKDVITGLIVNQTM